MRDLVNNIKEQDTTTKVGLAIVATIIVPLTIACFAELMTQAPNFYM